MVTDLKGKVPMVKWKIEPTELQSPRSCSIKNHCDVKCNFYLKYSIMGCQQCSAKNKKDERSSFYLDIIWNPSRKMLPQFYLLLFLVQWMSFKKRDPALFLSLQGEQIYRPCTTGTCKNRLPLSNVNIANR